MHQLHHRLPPFALVMIFLSYFQTGSDTLTHRYGSGVEGFYGYIWSIHGQFPQYPIWITEYAETSGNESGQTSSRLCMLDCLNHIFFSCPGLHEPNHNLPGFLILDRTLCLVWLFRESHLSELRALSDAFLQRPRPNITYSMLPLRTLRSRGF